MIATGVKASWSGARRVSRKQQCRQDQQRQRRGRQIDRQQLIPDRQFSSDALQAGNGQRHGVPCPGRFALFDALPIEFT